MSAPDYSEQDPVCTSGALPCNAIRREADSGSKMSDEGDLQHGRMHVRMDHSKPTLGSLIFRYVLFFMKSIALFYSAFPIAMVAIELGGSNTLGIFLLAYPWYGCLFLGLKTLEFMSREALFHLFLDYNLLIIFKKRSLLRMYSLWVTLTWVVILVALVFYSRGNNDAFVTLGTNAVLDGALIMLLFKEVDDLGSQMLTVYGYFCEARKVSDLVEQPRMSPSRVLEDPDDDVEKTHQLTRKGALELIGQQVSEMVFVQEGELKQAIKAMPDLTTKITSENPDKEVCSTELRKLYAQFHPSNFKSGSICTGEEETYGRNWFENCALFIHQRIWATRYIRYLSRNCQQPHTLREALKQPVSQAGFTAYRITILCIWVMMGLVVFAMIPIGVYIYEKSK